MVDRVFDVLIKRNSQLNVQKERDFDASLTFEEKNALRYTAGYVIKALLRKLKRSADPLKKEMISCLTELNNKYLGVTFMPTATQMRRQVATTVAMHKSHGEVEVHQSISGTCPTHLISE